MLVNLFQAYMLVSDKEFHPWICAKRDQYNEGKDYTVLQIMELAKNKFLGLQEDGLWKLQTPEEKKIIALTAEIANLKKKANKNPNAKKGKKGKKSDDKANQNKWYIKNPDNKKTIVRNKKTYHWCVHHGENGKWVLHHPDQCKLAKKKAKEDSDDSPKTNNQGDKEKKTKLKVLALQSILEEEDNF